MIICTSSMLSGCQVIFGVTCTTAVFFSPKYRYQDIEIQKFLVNEAINHEIELGPFKGAYPYDIRAADGKVLPEGITFRFYYKNADDTPVYLELEPREYRGYHDREWKFPDKDSQPTIYLGLGGATTTEIDASIIVKTSAHRTMCGNTDIAYRFDLKIE